MDTCTYHGSVTSDLHKFSVLLVVNQTMNIVVYREREKEMGSITYTVEPLIMDTLKSEQPPNNGQTVRPLPTYCPYISISEEGTTSEQWTKHSSPKCLLFRGSTVYMPIRRYKEKLD